MFFRILSRLLCQVNRLNRVLRLLSPEYVRHTCQTGTPLSRSKIQTLQPFAFWQRLLWHPSTETSSTSHHVVALPCIYIYIYIQLEVSVFLKFTMKIILALIATATTASAFVPAVSQNGVPQCTSVLPVVMRIVELE